MLVWIACTTVLLLAAVWLAYISWEAHERRRKRRTSDLDDFLGMIEERKKDPP